MNHKPKFVNKVIWMLVGGITVLLIVPQTLYAQKKENEDVIPHPTVTISSAPSSTPATTAQPATPQPSSTQQPSATASPINTPRPSASSAATPTSTPVATPVSTPVATPQPTPRPTISLGGFFDTPKPVQTPTPAPQYIPTVATPEPARPKATAAPLVAPRVQVTPKPSTTPIAAARTKVTQIIAPDGLLAPVFKGSYYTRETLPTMYSNLLALFAITLFIIGLLMVNPAAFEKGRLTLSKIRFHRKSFQGMQPAQPW